MKVKADLAARIVADFYSDDAAKQGAEAFRRVVQQGEVPENIQVFPLPGGVCGEASIRIDKLLREIGLCSSGAEANRKLKEGAVSINGEKHREMSYTLDPGVKELTIQMGKKWARVTLVE
jgi:tyrosyl-tRNA synthetase